MLNLKIDEMRGRVEFERNKISNTSDKECKKQNEVHGRLQRAMDNLNTENMTCNAKSMAINRRIEELETQIGVKTCTDELTGKNLF